MKKPKLLAVTGISGSGKTPVCHYISWEKRVHYEPEVSEYLIYQGYKPGSHADPVLFDYYIMKMELNRDRQLVSHLPFWIVETWHPGNIAHMYARGSPLLPQYLSKIRSESLKGIDALCLHIEGGVKESVKRADNLGILGVKKSVYDPEEFLLRLVEGYEYAFDSLHSDLEIVRINAQRTSLKELEAECLKVAHRFFGDLKWDYS